MSALLDLAAADAGAESDVSSAHEAGVKRQRTNDPSFGGSSSVLPEEPEPEDAMHNGAHPQFYASVRVRQPKKRYQDEVCFDRNSSRRTGAYAVGGGSSNPRAQRREAEAPGQAASDEDNAAGLESRAAAGQQPLTADEARAAAAAEGLELVPSSASSGRPFTRKRAR